MHANRDHCHHNMPLGYNYRHDQSLRPDKLKENKFALHERPLCTQSRLDVPSELTYLGYTKWADNHQGLPERASLPRENIQVQ